MAEVQPTAAAAAQPQPNNRTLITFNRTRNHNQLVQVRDRLFHTLFYRGALAYARTFPKPIRRFIEFIVLVKAFAAFFVLVYIHFSFSKTSNTCLDSAVANWPRDGILRVEIISEVEKGYGLKESYAKEERMLKLGRDDLSSILGLLTTRLDLEPSTLELSRKETTEPLANHKTLPIDMTDSPQLPIGDAHLYPNASSTRWHWRDMLTDTPKLEKPLAAITKNTSLLLDDDKLSSKSLEYKFIDKNDIYIVEYSLEYGYLRLSPAARERLNIPVKLVFLDPANHKCFGDPFSRLILQEFLGYNDLLMTAIKSFAEKEQNKGYLKNVGTGEHYRFVNLWMGKTSYIPAAVCMILFTVVVSMLLRYAHHQIFVFIVDLLQMLEFNMSITFPTAPLLTVILALVGIEAIMSEFFNDTSTAFYIILIVWLADQYDSVCCHTPTTKRHWLKFFYLHHFVFYAYHYRFNGQYTGLCLIVHWLFIQHSMIYFFHHYELPVILQQAQFQQLLLRSAQQPLAGGGSTDLAHTNNSFPPVRRHLSQFLSAVRPSATTQTSTIAVIPVATATVATSTSTITTASGTRTTVTVGTIAQPVNTSQSIQTMPPNVETSESQTSTAGGNVVPSVAVSIQTNDEGTRPPPHGGPDQPA